MQRTKSREEILRKAEAILEDRAYQYRCLRANLCPDDGTELLFTEDDPYSRDCPFCHKTFQFPDDEDDVLI